MTGHLLGFVVYTLAMMGIIFLAYLTARKFLSPTGSTGKNNFLKVESFLSIEPRKTIYVVKAGAERFLVSSGADGCRFMTKLEKTNIPVRIESDAIRERLRETENYKAANQELNNTIGKILTQAISSPVSVSKAFSKPDITSPKGDYVGLKDILGN